MGPTSEFIFQNAAVGILMVGSQGELLRLNSAAVAMLYLKPETVLGKHVGEVFRENRPLIRLSLPGGPKQLNIRLSNNRLASGIGGDISGQRIVVLHDVTERHDLDSRRDALIKSISHDLRNPINALGGYADLIRKFGALNPQQERFMTRIQQTTNKLYEMTEKLVDLSWIEAGMPLEHIPVELIGLTREVMRELSYEAYKAGVSIVNSIPDECPAVMGDPRSLKKAIYYLLDNAIRYSMGGNNVVIHAWHNLTHVYYTVADQGIGISEEDQTKIWDRLWRSSDERVRDVAGAGIGLTYVRTVIRRHGGNIHVDSTLNEGTTFTFQLPLMRGS
jgi:two-component system sensor histidine kinase VicK